MTRDNGTGVENPLYAELNRLRGVVGELIEEKTTLKKEIHELVTHNEYKRVGVLIGSLVAEKQEAYGDSFGKAGDVLRILYPDGIHLEQYDDLLGVARTVDKLFRIATDRDALGESPWGDISGYGLLGQVRVDRKKRGMSNADE